MLRRMVVKLVANPFGLLKRAIVKTFFEKSRYGQGNDYDALNYWKDRFSKYRLSLKGAGDEGLSEEANRKEYSKAAEIFKFLCARESVDFEVVRVLDIGCGNGFYAGLLSQLGVQNYTGMDITDVLFAELRTKFPNFAFIQQDVSQKEIEGEFDLVVMIDVAQHIVDEYKFSRAMQHIGKCLSRGGLLIVTTARSSRNRFSPFYLRNRNLKVFESEFPGCIFGDALPFRDQHLLSIRKIS